MFLVSNNKNTAKVGNTAKLCILRNMGNNSGIYKYTDKILPSNFYSNFCMLFLRACWENILKIVIIVSDKIGGKNLTI